jgi:hypothetical protein
LEGQRADAEAGAFQKGAPGDAPLEIIRVKMGGHDVSSG